MTFALSSEADLVGSTRSFKNLQGSYARFETDLNDPLSNAGAVRRPHLKLQPVPNESDECLNRFFTHHALGSSNFSEVPKEVSLVIDHKYDKGNIGVNRWKVMGAATEPVIYNLDDASLNHMRFTSPPLEADLEMTGIAAVELMMVFPHGDGDGADISDVGGAISSNENTHLDDKDPGIHEKLLSRSGSGSEGDKCAGTEGSKDVPVRSRYPVNTGDLIVLLECIEENGKAAYVSEALLRLRHRKNHAEGKETHTVATANAFPFEYMPVRTFIKADDLQASRRAFSAADSSSILGTKMDSNTKGSSPGFSPGLPADQRSMVANMETVVVEMLPMSFMFKRGQRIRVAIYGADTDCLTPQSEDPSMLSIFTGNMGNMEKERGKNKPMVHGFSKISIPCAN
jgi:hypothetical protein